MQSKNLFKLWLLSLFLPERLHSRACLGLLMGQFRILPGGFILFSAASQLGYLLFFGFFLFPVLRQLLKTNFELQEFLLVAPCFILLACFELRSALFGFPYSFLKVVLLRL